MSLEILHLGAGFDINKFYKVRQQCVWEQTPSLHAEFIDSEEGRILIVDTQAKSWGPNYFQLGFSWEDNFSLDSYVALDLAYVMTDLTQYGGEWRNAVRLGFEKLLSLCW